jgi:iron complex transport system substrate-binding protein
MLSRERLQMNKRYIRFFLPLLFLTGAFRFYKRTRLNACILLPFFGSILFYSCNNSTGKKEEQLADFNSTTDYFPEKIQVKYARGFSVRYFNNYKLVDIVSASSSVKDTQHYILVQRGTPAPELTDKPYTVIEIPIRNIICLASTHFALTDFLGVNNMVVGVSDTNYVYNPEIRTGIKEGKIKEVGKGDILNTELIVAMHPDLLMTVGAGNNKKGNYQSLLAAGVKLITNSEWMEPTPLGRAEWVKLLALFLNKEKLVEEKFTAVEQAYTSLTNLTKTITVKPKVITGMSYKGIWFVPGGNTYMAKFLNDAGAAYYWAHDPSTGSLELNLEAVYAVALHADVWLNIGTGSSRKEVEAQDERFKLFKSFKTGRMYNCIKRTNPNGSNDYWESGIVSPHLVLADLIHILHPGLLRDSTLTYYKKIE